jgi:hypothetical protein
MGDPVRHGSGDLEEQLVPFPGREVADHPDQRLLTYTQLMPDPRARDHGVKLIEIYRVGDHAGTPTTRQPNARSDRLRRGENQSRQPPRGFIERAARPTRGRKVPEMPDHRYPNQPPGQAAEQVGLHPVGVNQIGAGLARHSRQPQGDRQTPYHQRCAPDRPGR